MQRIFWLGLLGLATVMGWQQVQAGGQKGTVVELGGLRSTTPGDWKVETPSNKFRAYQFTVPKAQGDTRDAEVVIFFFGQGSGGSADENIKRWKKMFLPPEGKSIEEVSKVETLKVGKVPLTYLDVRGTYVFKNPPFDPNAKEERHPNHRMLSVFFDNENGPYFIRLTGPAKTVEQQKKNFDEWLKNFK
jgi:hypothetical protein